jgi:inorganic phosphate transporter, PiT family
MTEPVFLIGIFLVALLAFANGSNDVSKGIATLVGSGVTDYRKAILWGTVWTVFGGLLGTFFSLAMVKTFTSGILSAPADSMPSAIPIAVIIGATAWVLFASRTGLPVSTTHAITGALCGAGLAAWGAHGIAWATLSQRVFLPLAVSPLLAFGLVLLVSPGVKYLLSGWRGHCFCLLPVRKAQLAIDQRGLVRIVPAQTELTPIVNDPQCDSPQVLSLRVGPDTFHWATSGLTSLARGLNDAPKMVALLVGLSLFAGAERSSVLILGFILVGIGMGLGSYMAGIKVTRFLAEKVTPMDHLEGFSANLATSILVTFAARFGLPVSTTHLSSSAILGIGLRNHSSEIRWKTVGEMVLAWIVTLPVAALISAVSYGLISIWI